MMSEQDKKGLAEVLSDNAEGILVGVLAVAVVAALVVGGAYVIYFKGVPVSGDPGSWGQLGDYLGGVLNPVFGFLSVFALLVALVLQTRELKLSRESLSLSREELRLSREEQAKAAGALEAQNSAIRRQSFEQTFFSWLSSYESRLNEIEIIIDHDSGAQRRGRRVLYEWWRGRVAANSIFNFLREGIPPDLVKSASASTNRGKIHILQVLPTDIRGAAVVKAFEKWDCLYAQWESELDSLFRDLYRLLLWVDSQDKGNLSTSQKWLYVSIIRAKLSWIELVYLFYNAQTPRGSKFKVLMEKYAILDNLTLDADCVLAFVKEQPGDGRGFAHTAYCSVTARRALGLPDSAEEVLALASGS